MIPSEMRGAQGGRIALSASSLRKVRHLRSDLRFQCVSEDGGREGGKNEQRAHAGKGSDMPRNCEPHRTDGENIFRNLILRITGLGDKMNIFLDICFPWSPSCFFFSSQLCPSSNSESSQGEIQNSSP